MQQIPSIYTRYKLTDKEFELGSSFNEFQRAYLQNLLAETAEDKTKLTFDLDSPEAEKKFIQQEAYHVARIELLIFLLEPLPIED